ARQGPIAPRAAKDLWLDQHGHVAADAVAAIRHAPELGDHRLAQPGVAIVELDGVGPPREVRVAAEGQDLAAARGRERAPVLRLALLVVLRALDEVLRV